MNPEHEEPTVEPFEASVPPRPSHAEPGAAEMQDAGVSPKTLLLLERLDNLAHVVVAAFFIFMAATVLVYTGILLYNQLPLIGAAVAGRIGFENRDFFDHSLELLSHILFIVIILELLRTIITYLQTRDIQAIMKEFLVVGIISSVRKILLVGAQSSLAGEKGAGEFVQEAYGTILSIVGILLLILGLIALERFYGSRKAREGAAEEATAN